MTQTREEKDSMALIATKTLTSSNMLHTSTVNWSFYRMLSTWFGTANAKYITSGTTPWGVFPTKIKVRPVHSHFRGTWCSSLPWALVPQTPEGETQTLCLNFEAARQAQSPSLCGPLKAGPRADEAEQELSKLAPSLWELPGDVCTFGAGLRQASGRRVVGRAAAAAGSWEGASGEVTATSTPAFCPQRSFFPNPSRFSTTSPSSSLLGGAVQHLQSYYHQALPLADNHQNRCISPQHSSHAATTLWRWPSVTETQFSHTECPGVQTMH